jgi:hypothetical protein
MAKEISITDIYKAKNAAEAEINDILKGFTINTGMDVDGIDVMAIPTKEDKINTYYRCRLSVKL